MMTTKELAQANQIQPASLARKLTRWHDKGFIVEPYGLNDILPFDVIDRILSDNKTTTGKTRTTTRQVTTETVKEEETVNTPEPVPMSPPSAVIETPAPIQVKREIPTLFKDRTTLYIAAFILISADAVSCGWIAWNEYEEFQTIAAVFFGLAGIAIGYSAIRMVISYYGWHSDSFAWGFGIFQVFLHLSAMQTFGDEWSYYIGKIMISLALPLATAGIALAFKSVLK